MREASRSRTLCINEPMLKREHDLSRVAHRYLHRIDLAIKKYQGIDHLHRIIQKRKPQLATPPLIALG